MFANYVSTVPPLEGFVMNRVLGDYFETLLYKVFVSLDEHTSIADVSPCWCFKPVISALFGN